MAFFIVNFVVPLAIVLGKSLTDPDGGLSAANYWSIVSDPYYWSVLGYTFWIGLFTALACVVIGYPLAYYMSLVERRPWVRRLCVLLVLMPLFTSSIVRSIAWIVILGRNGLVNGALDGVGLIDKPLRILGTEYAIMIGMTYVLTPFVILTVASSLQNIDRSVLEAGRDLGAGALTVFRKVTLPLSLPGVFAGTLIVFTLSISSYVTPQVMSGGRSVVMSMLIYNQYMLVFDPAFGGALAVVLLTLSMLIIVCYSWVLWRYYRVR
jgi:putative spermidine/putrescine transport system permease protein